jgi:hypothetical protein
MTFTVLIDKNIVVLTKRFTGVSTLVKVRSFKQFLRVLFVLVFVDFLLHPRTQNLFSFIRKQYLLNCSFSGFLDHIREINSLRSVIPLLS